MSATPAAPPAAADIIAARKAAGLTQSQAAALVCASLRTWQQWEAGDRRMPAGLFALFLLRQREPKKAATDPRATGTPGARVVAASRQAAGLTVAEAAKLCHRTAKEWLCAESGLRPLDTAAWELYLLRVGQHPQWTLAPRRKA